MKKNTNKEFVIITYLMLLLILSLAVYFVYFLFFKSEGFINNSYNPRISSLSASVIRGDIVSSDGVILAENVVTDNGTVRNYPNGNMYAHSVGYAGKGMSGMEKDYNFNLLRSHSFVIDRFGNEILNNKNKGDTIVSTLNSKVQSEAYYGLGSYKGAVIAIDPKNGNIIAMVSKPDFNPNEVEANWEELSSKNTSAVLLNRTINGLYPPGSTFKIVTALEYLREGGSSEDEFTCNGSISSENMQIHCYNNKAHGNIDFTQAFSKSCNTVFAGIGAGLNRNSFNELLDSLMFNKKLPTSTFTASKSRINVTGKTDNAAMMQIAIGQGDTLVTPIHMAMLVSAIENNGVLMKPRLVSEIKSFDESYTKTIAPKEYGALISESEANTIKEYMRQVVENGTGKALLDTEYTCYGKTGTAEFSNDKNIAHSWFVGFAEYNDKQLAIAVIMEEAGSGGEYAAPLARKVFDVYFSNP